MNETDTKLASIIPRLRGGLTENRVSRPSRGRVREITGLMISASLDEARMGEICDLVDPKSGQRGKAEVVGLRDDTAILLPLGDIENLSNLTEVIPTRTVQRVRVGTGLLGRVIDSLGNPIDGAPLDPDNDWYSYPVMAQPPEPMQRKLISEPIHFGVRAIDGMLTCAKGQRIGLFGAPGVGKSLLLADIVEGSSADVTVVALIGERGREVREFMEHHLGTVSRQRCVVVAATSDRPGIERVKAAHTATTIAEYFRDQGKHVLLAVDNITRFARAQREIGLAAGEPPTRRGFPPSFFAALPRLLERAGPGSSGSITGLYNVLMEGDGNQDPVVEEVQALLDGHIFLSADLAQRNHFPAIDVVRSNSRLMSNVIDDEHRAAAAQIRRLLARYQETELLVRIGEYEHGADALTDEAIAKIDRINDFLQQKQPMRAPIEETLRLMRGLTN
ncbi:FliI/YscN family ATPase [Brucella tritici]|uniref:FliI/YscN family ATPase n=1 Tax=Brucella tritici TaxID=94626 RepID=A0A833CHW1_9HYPH|nr:FliI/YscN family ATPase [Brucella tritici]